MKACKSAVSAGWDKQKVLRIISNPTYSGKLTIVFKPTESVIGFEEKATVKQLDVPAIVSVKTFEAAQTIHLQRRHKLLDSWTDRVGTNWLHGQVGCPECDAPLVGFMSSVGIRYYKCENSTAKDSHGMHRCEDFEKQVEGKLLARAAKVLEPKKLLAISKAQAKTATPNNEKQLKSFESQIKKKQQELKRLNTGYLQGLFDEDEFKDLKKEVTKALAALEKSKGKLEAEAVKTDDASLRTISQLKKRLEQLNEEKFELLSDEELADAERLRAELLANLSAALVKSYKLKKLEVPDAKQLSDEKLEKLYRSGFVTAKQVRDARGWAPKKLGQLWGKSPRKKAIEFEVGVRWK